MIILATKTKVYKNLKEFSKDCRKHDGINENVYCRIAPKEKELFIIYNGFTKGLDIYPIISIHNSEIQVSRTNYVCMTSIEFFEKFLYKSFFS